MANEFDFNLDELPGLEEGVEPVAQETSKPAGRNKRKKRRKAGPEYDSPTSDISLQDAAQVSGRGSRMSGQYVQLNFRLPPEYVERIDQIAQEEGATKEDIKRWLLGMGLAAYLNGERPQADTRKIRDIRLPDLPDS